MAGDIPTIPGHQVLNHIAQELRRLVADLVGQPRPAFPGAQPVSFTRTHSIPALLNEDYYVCEKSDGVRVLVLMLASAQHGPQTYFITRKNEYFLAPATCFPVPHNPRLDRFHDRSLIDAELVVDVEPDGRRVRKLLAFDALVLAGTSCMDRILDKRLGYLREHVVAPFAELLRRLPPDQRARVPVVAEMKAFERGYGVPRVYSEIVPRLRHASDGLIFTSVAAPYTPGTCATIIKWKPASENSVDFKLSVRGAQLELTAWQGNNDYVDFAPLLVLDDDQRAVLAREPQLDGRIVEAVRDPESSRWRVLRFRDDKAHGNHVSVISRIIESIGDGLELDELCGFMPQIRENWKRRHNES